VRERERDGEREKERKRERTRATCERRKERKRRERERERERCDLYVSHKKRAASVEDYSTLQHLKFSMQYRPLHELGSNSDSETKQREQASGTQNKGDRNLLLRHSPRRAYPALSHFCHPGRSSRAHMF